MGAKEEKKGRMFEKEEKHKEGINGTSEGGEKKKKKIKKKKRRLGGPNLTPMGKSRTLLQWGGKQKTKKNCRWVGGGVVQWS